MEAVEANHLLSLLPRQDLARLEPHLHPVWFERREVIYDGERPLEFILFPTSCVVSLVQTMQNGATAGAATIGPEGMTGILLPVGAARPLGRKIAQLPGEGLKIETKRLWHVAQTTPAVLQIMQRFVQTVLIQLAQAAGCNQFHSAKQRCARWLLALRDRSKGDELQLTHEFLAEMLGVRRATVTQVIDQLEAAGALRVGHGRVRIVDRARLEAAACECYQVVRARSRAALESAAPGGD